MIVSIASFASTFCMLFLKGLQYQNIVGGHYKATFLVAFALVSAEVLLFALVATHGLVTLVPASLGGAIGSVLSMYVHRKYMRKGKG